MVPCRHIDYFEGPILLCLPTILFQYSLSKGGILFFTQILSRQPSAGPRNNCSGSYWPSLITLPWDAVHATGSTPYQWLIVGIHFCRAHLISMQMGSRLSKQKDMILERSMCGKEEGSTSCLIAHMDRCPFEEEVS